MQTFKSYWICHNERGLIDLDSIRPQRNLSIKAFMGESSLTWEEIKKKGWTCSKVNIEITLVKS